MLCKRCRRKSFLWAFLSTVITGIRAHRAKTLRPAQTSPIRLPITSAHPTRCNWPKLTTARSNGDSEDHSAYLHFYRDQMREWIFFTDLHTFKDRYEVVQQKGLQGFCSWVLGEEDPEIWKFLPHRR